MTKDQLDEKQTKIEPSDGPRKSIAPQIPAHELLRCIGSGSYGDVWLARNVMGTYRAVKVVYRRTFSDERPYEREFSGMQKFEPVSRSHDGLVDILQVGRNDAAGDYYYVMELGDDQDAGQEIDPATYQPKTLGNEATRRGRLPFDECLQIGLSLSAALEHLHKRGLIHRDIKPSNIIFVNGIPKVADIGLVAAVGGSKSFVGTTGFIPPEGPGTIQADIYSLGKVLYEISTGHDRQIFPELPTQLDEIPRQPEFLELNEVILRACEADVQKRYRTAGEMHADLLLLQAGKSVKRLRLLEKRLALLTRLGVIAGAILLMAGAVFYQVSRELKMAAERRQQQVGRNVSYGTRLADEGDFFGSLPPFVEALSLEQHDVLREKSHRARIAAMLQHCPKIVQMWFLDCPLNSAALSPDGRSVLAAGTDGRATLLDVEQGINLPAQIRHSNELEGVSFSRDGRFVIITASNSAQVWELSSGKRVLSLDPPGTVYSARFNGDGSQIVTASGGATNGYVWLWDAVTGRRLMEVQKSGNAFRCAVFSPDDRRIVTACENNTAQVWELKTQQPVGQPIRHTDWVYYAAFSPDGTLVATASYDTTVQVCDAETGRPVLPPLKHPAAVGSVEFSPDGRYLVTAGWDFSARIWNRLTGQIVNPPLKHGAKHLKYASFSPDGRRVLTADVNGVICLWDLASKIGLPVVSRFVASADGERLASVRSNAITVLDATNDATVSTIQITAPLINVKLSRDGSRLLSLSAEIARPGPSPTVAQLWDSRSAQALSPPFSIGVLDRNATRASLSDEGERLLTYDGMDAHVWDAIAGKKILSLRPATKVTGACFSPDRRWLVTRSGTNAVVWDAADGKEVHVLQHEYPVVHAAFSPDGLRLVTCTSDDTLLEREAQVWDVATGHKIGTALKHADGVLYASFSPDSKRVITASDDFTARVWEAATGRPLLPPLQHRAQVTEACFSPDGRWIATACENDLTARIWDAENGEPLTPPLKQPWQFKHVQFVGNGRAILTRTSKGESAFWKLPGDEHPIDDLARFAQLLSGHQRDFTGGVLPQAAGALSNNWQRLRAQYPADFRVAQNEILAWHLNEAEASEKAGLWSAALFHWERLIEKKPQNKSFQDRRAAAQQSLISEH